MRRLKETPSQTAGPYVHIGLVPERAGWSPGRAVAGPDLLAELNAQASGARQLPPGVGAIEIEGRVIDASSSAVLDAVVELWQADHEGRFDRAALAGFRGWGRSAVDPADGMFRFFTIKPGAVPGAGGLSMAPHLALWIVARGINLGLHTRMYFPEDSELHLADPVLRTVEPAVRRATLVGALVEAQETPQQQRRYRFDIVLQGPQETVFFDV